MSADEPDLPAFFLPSLSGRHYRCFGGYAHVLVRPARTSTGGPAYDLFVPADAFDAAYNAERHPGVAAKVQAQGRDYVYTRVGPTAYAELRLERNPVLETAFGTYLP